MVQKFLSAESPTEFPPFLKGDKGGLQVGCFKIISRNPSLVKRGTRISLPSTLEDAIFRLRVDNRKVDDPIDALEVFAWKARVLAHGELKADHITDDISLLDDASKKLPTARWERAEARGARPKGQARGR